MAILSIQSHVSYGHVGNSAGVFILQRMGYGVWPVHTVLYSNHPGYGAFKGQAVAPGLIADVITGIEGLGVLSQCRAVIGGYIGSAETGDVLLDAVERVKRVSPDCLFFCDPVMGDRGKGLYVTDDIVRFYSHRGGPASDILKPNAFELEILSGQPVRTPSESVAAARVLIERWGLRAVVVSSVPLQAVPSSPPSDSDGSSLIACVVATASQAWVVETPLLPIDQKGAGDAFMALFVAYLLQVNGNLPTALMAATSAIWSLIDCAVPGDSQELQLIDGQDNFFNPSRTFKVVALDL